MSDQYRFGDETPPADRSERLYQEDGQGPWFFRTREGIPMGPFETAAEAEQALNDFIEFIRLADLQTLSELTRSLGAEESGAVQATADGEKVEFESVELEVVQFEAVTPPSAVAAWDPAEAVAPTTAQLESIASRLAARDNDSVSGLLAADEIDRFGAWMRLDLAVWPPLIGGLGDQQLVDLLRFFTLAEQAFAGWDAGKKSPAIAIARELRNRGRYPAELTSWIRRHSENRYLPYGSILDRL